MNTLKHVTSKVTWDVEHTDTFGDKWSGNYCWVRKHSFETRSDVPEVTVVRKAKALLGYTGRKCDKISSAEDIMLSPRNNTIIFITPRYA